MNRTLEVETMPDADLLSRIRFWQHREDRPENLHNEMIEEILFRFTGKTAKELAGSIQPVKTIYRKVPGPKLRTLSDYTVSQLQDEIDNRKTRLDSFFKEIKEELGFPATARVTIETLPAKPEPRKTAAESDWMGWHDMLHKIMADGRKRRVSQIQWALKRSGHGSITGGAIRQKLIRMTKQGLAERVAEGEYRLIW